MANQLPTPFQTEVDELEELELEPELEPPLLWPPPPRLGSSTFASGNGDESPVSKRRMLVRSKVEDVCIFVVRQDGMCVEPVGSRGAGLPIKGFTKRGFWAEDCA